MEQPQQLPRTQLRRVFLTGATGFVGGHVLRRLLQEAECQEVVCVVRSHSTGYQALQHLKAPQITFADGDLLTMDHQQLTDLIRGCDAVIHCAALYSWWQRRLEAFVSANERAARRVAEAALVAGVGRFVQVSTVLALGKPKGYGTLERPLTQTTPLGPASSSYAATKAAGDAAVLELVQQGLPACVVHLACVVGRDPKLVNPEHDVMRIAPLARGEVPATVAGETVFTYVDASDAAAAIIKAAEVGVPGRRYLIGGERLTTAEFYGIISELSGVPAPRVQIPLWLAHGWAAVSDCFSRYVTGIPPQAPPDLIQTVSEGTLLFDCTPSGEQLDLAQELPGGRYRPIKESFAETLALIRQHDSAASDSSRHPQQAAAEQRARQ